VPYRKIKAFKMVTDGY